MKFVVTFKTDDVYFGEMTINVSAELRGDYCTLLPGKARLVAEALLQAADAADAVGGAQAAIDALLADKPVDPREYTDASDLPL